MARWLEPSVQTKTSFEEAGLMRYGVLENMAPLGAMPKPKKPGGENSSTVRKIILRPSGGGLANTAPEANPPRPKSPPGSPPATVPPLPPPRKSLPPKDKEPENDEYDPKGWPRRRRSKRVSLPAKKMRQTPDEDPKRSAAMAKTPTPKAASPKKRQAPLEPEEREFADKVVESAVDEALKHYRYPTAWALRTLYDEKCDDEDFVAMVEDVFRQTADAETRDDFARLVEQKKREGKKGSRGHDYFVAPSNSSRLTPHKARPAPYASLLREAEGAEDQAAGDGRAVKRARTSQAATPRKTGAAAVHVRTPRSSRSNRHARRDSSISSSLSSAMSLSSPEGSPSLRGAACREASGAGHGDAPKSQPITTRGKTLASSRPAVSNTSESNTPTHHRPRHASAAVDDATSMPGRLAASELFANLPAKPAKHGTTKASPMLDEDEDSFWDKRRDARKATGAYSAQESSLRTGQEERVATPPRTTRRTRQLVAAPISTRATRSASKRPIADVERATSPAAFSWQGDGSPAVGSRAATPLVLRPTKKQRTGLRVKTS